MKYRVFCILFVCCAVSGHPGTAGGRHAKDDATADVGSTERRVRNEVVSETAVKGFLKRGTLEWDGKRVPDDISERVVVTGQRAFDSIPPGNYSGMVRLFGNYYAVVSDKTGDDGKGYFVFNIQTDREGNVSAVRNCGWQPLKGRNEDAEAVAYNPSTKHIYIGNEEGSTIEEYGLETDSLVARTCIAGYRDRGLPNKQIESLCYDASRQCLWTINEGPLKGDNQLMLRLTQLDERLGVAKEYTYLLDAPLADIAQPYPDNYAHGVAELLSLDDGTLLSLEREFYVPQSKLGAWVMNKVFRIHPGDQGKQFVAGWRTYFTLLDQSLANYEGMCEAPPLPDGRRVIILCADSQAGYGGVLKDWFRTIVIGKKK